MKGKLALVTGSTSGIGLGVARTMAACGANLVLNGFGDPDQIEEIRSSLASEFGIDVHYEGADLSSPSQIAEMMTSLNAKGGVDILVNNAGIQHVSPIESFDPSRWDQVISINQSAVFLTMHHALPKMREKNWGRIINIASAHGLVASAGKVAYVAAKHAVVGMTKVAALETARTGITCNTICPGWVLTPLVQQQIEARAKESGQTVEEASNALLGEKQPSLQFVTPEQIGETACFLCSDAAAQIRGTNISVDGGWTAQ
ncbi:MAG: 3-hydroxybutyrate dehydrogenase [Burkholderiaceae bacterium]